MVFHRQNSKIKINFSLVANRIIASFLQLNPFNYLLKKTGKARNLGCFKSVYSQTELNNFI